MTSRLSPITRITPQALLTATMSVRTSGIGFIEITRDAADFLREAKAADGALTVCLRQTSATLITHENSAPDVQTDLTDVLNRLAPQHAGYILDTEGPDDMPAHIKAMLTGVSLTIPVKDGKAALVTCQGIYL